MESCIDYGSPFCVMDWERYKCHIQNNEDMKCKFENSVNAILFLMFSSVLVTISFSNCMGGCHDSNDNSSLKQTGMDTINIDSVHN